MGATAKLPSLRQTLATNSVSGNSSRLAPKFLRWTGLRYIYGSRAAGIATATRISSISAADPYDRIAARRGGL